MSTPAPRRRPGGRSTRVRRAVIAATRSTLSEVGMDRLSIGAVAALAEVHESSIYRRWGTRENLMIDALLDEAEELLPVPDTGSLRTDLVTYLRELAAYLSTPNGLALDRALAATGDAAASQELRNRYWEVRGARSGGIVERAIARGELPSTVDPYRTVELLVAPLHFRAILTRAPIEPDLPEAIVDSVLDGLIGRPPSNHPDSSVTDRRTRSGAPRPNR